MVIACVLAALICKKLILNHLDSTLRSELITNRKTIGETSETYWVVSSVYSLKDDTRQPWERDCWFLKEQTSEKHCQWKKSRLRLLILDKRNWRPVHLKEDNVKIWVEVIIVTVCSSHRRCPHGKQLWLKSCLNSISTFCITMKSSSRFDRINKLHRDFSYWQILSLVCPWNTTWVHSLYLIDPRARAKMAGIVNKVYYSCYTTHSP